MKRATRITVRCVLPLNAGCAQDILDSDARQRAEIRDLKARLKFIKDALMDIAYVLPPNGESFVDYVDRIARAALAKVKP